jgi:hypothetical protein
MAAADSEFAYTFERIIRVEQRDQTDEGCRG